MNPQRFEAHWNGKDAVHDVRVDPHPFATPHFGEGVLTFHVSYLFRTEPEWNLLATGPFNFPKHGIAPLTGIIETDHASATFTMNWRFTRPGTVVFHAGEPFCQVIPIRADVVNEVEPVVTPLESDSELQASYEAWSASREQHIVEWERGDTRKRQADYTRSATRRRLHPRPFEDRTGRAVAAPVSEGGEMQESSTLLFPFTSDRIMIDEHFLPPEDAHALASIEVTPVPGREDVRLLDYVRDDPPLFEIAQRARTRTIDALREQYGIDRDVYLDYAALATIGPDHARDQHPLHADNQTLDGSPNHTPHRVVSALLYLNEQGVDFEGGTITFPNVDPPVEIHPKPGTLVGFRADLAHAHVVDPVTSGHRKAIAWWFTFDPNGQEYGW
jgi:hypothetical protein